MEMLLFFHNVHQNHLGFSIILRENLTHCSCKTRAFKTNQEGCLFKVLGVRRQSSVSYDLEHTFQFPSVLGLTT